MGLDARRRLPSTPIGGGHDVLLALDLRNRHLVPYQGDFDAGPFSPLPRGEGAKTMSTESLKLIATQY